MMARMAVVLLTVVAAVLAPASIGVSAGEEAGGGDAKQEDASTNADYIALLRSSDVEALPRVLSRLSNEICKRPKEDYSQLVPHVLRHLSSTDDEVFRRASWALSLIGSEAGLEQIHALSKTAGPERRGRLAWLLGRIGSEKSVPVLIPWLQVKDLEFRKTVLFALRGVKSRDTVESLMDVALHDPFGTCRAYAIEALAEIPDPRSIAPLIALMARWPVELEKEPIRKIRSWGRRSDGSSFCETEEFNPRDSHRKYMVPNVILPALEKLTNHGLAGHEAWAKWWEENKAKGLEQVFLDGFTGYSVSFSEASIPVFIEILEDRSLRQYKRVNAQRTLSKLMGGVHWDESHFQPMKWAANWRAMLNKDEEAEHIAPADADKPPR